MEEGQQCIHHERKGLQKGATASVDKQYLACFGRSANWAAGAMRHPLAFVLAVLVILGWVPTGPFFGFSGTWQLVINTGTTILTFLMVFFMQNTQNRESAAVQPISHREVMIIDGETIFTRRFDFTKATRERNMERLLIFRDPGPAKQYTRNWETHQQHRQP